MRVRTPVQAFPILVNRSSQEVPSNDPNQPSDKPLEPNEVVFQPNTVQDEEVFKVIPPLLGGDWQVEGKRDGATGVLKVLPLKRNRIFPAADLKFTFLSDDEPPVAEAGYADVNVERAEDKILLRVRGEVVIGDDLRDRNVPVTREIIPDVLTIHFSDKDDDKGKMLPVLLDAGAELKPENVKDVIDLKAKGTDESFDFNVIAGGMKGERQIQGYLVVTAKWTHRKKTQGSNTDGEPMTRIARMPIRLQEGAESKVPYRVVTLSPRATQYLWATARIQDSRTMAPLLVNNGAFFAQVRNVDDSAIHYRAAFTATPDGKIHPGLLGVFEAVFGVPVEQDLLIRAEGIKGRDGTDYFDRGEYVKFTKDQRARQLNETTEPGSPALAEAVLLAVP